MVLVSVYLPIPVDMIGCFCCCHAPAPVILTVEPGSLIVDLNRFVSSVGI
jgi:hypothetical protein